MQHVGHRRSDEVHQLRLVIGRLRLGIAAIKQATVEGRVCDDVAWFDTITTLHDYCDQLLDEPLMKPTEG